MCREAGPGDGQVYRSTQDHVDPGTYRVSNPQARYGRVSRKLAAEDATS
jgi:hypothetical protein